MEIFGTLDDLMHWPILAILGLKRLQTITRAHVKHDRTVAYIVDRDDDVYRVQKDIPNLIHLVELSCQKIRAFVTEKGHFALSEDGDLYNWRSIWDTPTLLRENVTRLETGSITIDGNTYHTVALTADGDGWGWKTVKIYHGSGRNAWAEEKETCIDINLGTASGHRSGARAGHSVSDIVYQSDLAVDRPVVRVERLNDRVLLALADDGRISARNNCRSEKPYVIEYEDRQPVRFVDIAVVQSKTLAVSTDGTIYLGEDSDNPVLTSTGVRNINNVLANNGLGTYRTIVILEYNNFDTSRDFDNITLSDCHFSVRGDKIHASKMLLRMKSDYFKTMFDGEWKESNGEITITGHSYSVYKSLLRFLCTGFLSVADNDLLQLTQLAHETMNDNLTRICQEKLRFKLTAQNIIDVYLMAKTLELQSLLSYCKQFTIIYTREIVERELAQRPELTTQLLTFATAKDDEKEDIAAKSEEACANKDALSK